MRPCPAFANAAHGATIPLPGRYGPPKRRTPVKIGVPKEIKTHEYRVGLTPASVRELTRTGHHVMVQQGAAAGIGFPDDAYRQAGAAIGVNAAEVFAFADMVVKVKEP